MAIEAHHSPSAEIQAAVSAAPSDIQAGASTWDKATNWLSEAASDTWSATTGAARVAGQVGLGAAEEVYEHPVKALAEVGTGIAAGAAMVAGGVTLAEGAALAAVPLAAYGVYKAGDIAIHEGVGAIPAHMADTYHEVKNGVAGAFDAASTVYHGSADRATLDASQQRLQTVGRYVVPFAAGMIGGAGSQLGTEAVTVAGSLATRVAESTLPSLTLEPAYATVAGAGTSALEVAAARAAAGLPAAAAAESLAESPLIMRRTDDSSPPGGSGPRSGEVAQSASTDEGAIQQQFIDGRRVGTPAAASPEGTSLGNAFKSIFIDADKTIASGGRIGNIQLTKEDDGWLFARIEEGPMEGTTAMYKPGDKSFLFERKAGSSSVKVEMP